MTTLEEIKICEKCGNVFSKEIRGEKINRCPACKVWTQEKQN